MADQEQRPPRTSIRVLRWARRTSQAGFLALFVFLLMRSTYPGAGSGAGTLQRPLEPVEAFFRFDPFAALVTFFASHRFYVALLPSLAVVALTLVFGRAVCGWVCPMGTLNQSISWLLRPRTRSRRAARNLPTHLSALKYYVLAGSLGAALFGSALGGWLDPIALLARGLGLVVLPAVDLTAPSTVDPFATGLGSVMAALQGVASTAGTVAGSIGTHRTHGGWLIGALLLAVLAANAWVPRFYCRAICPLGALLGLLSRLGLTGMQKNHDACIACAKCEEHCQGADAPRGGEAWRESECVLCLNCEASCPTRVIRFGLLPPREETAGRVGITRRRALASGAAGAALIPLSRIGEGLELARDPRLIRPPGALPELEMLARCIRCGQCMRSCPTNAIHPTLGEAGIEGLWTPFLIMRVGYCEPSCVTCGQVCPTGAIRPITEDQKLGRDAEPIRIGTAFIERGRCLPWAMGTPCIVCEEFCPASPKAIWTEEVAVTGAEGETITLHRPQVNPSRCTGCGACEHVCPVRTTPAIQVTSVGESRSRENQILLRRRSS